MNVTVSIAEVLVYVKHDRVPVAFQPLYKTHFTGNTVERVSAAALDRV
jgi:hypothetical protein